MLTDANKGITNILYNHLNLPAQVTIAGQNILYIYDAVGTKLRKTVSGITTDYSGNYIYENGVLQFFNTAEGYVEPVSTGSTTFVYVFQYKDHLGNIRLSYADADGNGIIAQTEIREENNYYPFGLKHKGYNSTLTGKDHKYGFGNKEEQDELGLGWIDITARNYDPALGRWMNLDPLAELMRRHSPYNYAFDNPVYFIDADGMMPFGNNCCGGKPSPTERIKEGFNTVFSGIKKAFTQFFSDNDFGTSGAGLKPTENVSTVESVVKGISKNQMLI